MSKSAMIRQLYDEGCTITAISKQLGIHYSFVHTVVRRHEEVGPKKVTKAEQIRELWAQGKTKKEIVQELGVEYSHVSNSLRTRRSDSNDEQRTT